MSEVKQEMKGTKQEVNEVRQDMTGLKQEVNEVRQDMTGLKQEVNEVRQGMNGLTQEVNEMKQDMKAMRKDFFNEMKEIRCDIRRIDHKLKVFLQDLGDARGDISILQSKVFAESN